MEQVSTFQERISELIREYSVTELAIKLGMSKQSISAYHLGTRTPKRPTITHIANTLNVNPAWLLGYDAQKYRVVHQASGHGETVIDGSATLTGSGYFSARGEVIGPKSIPILGTIAAGIPLYAEQYVEGYLAVPPHWPVNYALRVKGESMIGAGIPDGSLVLCKAQQDVDNGQIAVCIVDGEEATLKRVRRYGDVLVLQPENPAFAERTFAGEDRAVVSIQGLAIKVIRDVM